MSCDKCKYKYDTYHKMKIGSREITVCETCNLQYLIPLCIKLESVFDKELKEQLVNKFFYE